MAQKFGAIQDADVASRILFTCLPGGNDVLTKEQWIALGQTGDPAWPGRILGAAYYRAGRYEESLQQFDIAASNTPLRAWDLLFMAMAHHQLGHVQAARDCFDQGVAWAQRYPVAWSEQAETAALQQEAEKLLRISLTDSPGGAHTGR
jgi:tetratricopeptide (TPR) repeat protein